MLLKNKTAVIYGGGGAVGSAVAKAFAKEGAAVFIAGRASAKQEAVAGFIIENGGIAQTAVVDAFSKNEVEIHLASVVQQKGAIDIFFNATGMGGEQGNPLSTMAYEEFVLPISNAMKAQFTASVAAADCMGRQGGGVILTITANAARKPYPDIGGFGVACAAIEGFCRQLAMEYGPLGIRVVCLRSSGSPDTPGVSEVWDMHAANAGVSRVAFERAFVERTMLKRLPLLEEIAGAAVLMASNRASAITAAVINLTCGELSD